MAVHVQDKIRFIVKFHVAMITDEFMVGRMSFRMFLQANTTEKCSIAFIADMLDVVVTIFVILQMIFCSKPL